MGVPVVPVLVGVPLKWREGPCPSRLALSAVRRPPHAAAIRYHPLDELEVRMGKNRSRRRTSGAPKVPRVEQVAYHEAGHAVLAFEMRRKIVSVTVKPTRTTGAC